MLRSVLCGRPRRVLVTLQSKGHPFPADIDWLKCKCKFAECRRPPTRWFYASCGTIVVFDDNIPDHLDVLLFYRRSIDKLCLEVDMAECLLDSGHRSRRRYLYSWMQIYYPGFVLEPPPLKTFIEEKEAKVSELCYHLGVLLDVHVKRPGEC